MKSLARMLASLVVIGVAVLLLVSGFDKARDPSHFAALLASHGLIDEAWSLHAAVTLAWMQIVLAILSVWCLVVNRPLLSASLLACMFLTFGTMPHWSRSRLRIPGAPAAA